MAETPSPAHGVPPGHFPDASPGDYLDNHLDDHLDDLLAMRLADGEPVPPPVVAHAQACDLCAALVAAFRDDASTLAGALALDTGELAFLAQANVPDRVVSLVIASGGALEHAHHVRRDSPATLAAIFAAATAGYAGWLYGSPAVSGAAEFARQLGLTSVAAHLVTGWVIAFCQFAWDALDAATANPVVNAPLITILVVAALALAAVLFMPQPGAMAPGTVGGTA